MQVYAVLLKDTRTPFANHVLRSVAHAHGPRSIGGRGIIGLLV